MAQQFDNALHVMEVQGGSFVKSLANCFYAADPANRAILRQAFAHYFAEYEARFAALESANPAKSGMTTMKPICQRCRNAVQPYQVGVQRDGDVLHIDCAAKEDDDVFFDAGFGSD